SRDHAPADLLARPRVLRGGVSAGDRARRRASGARRRARRRSSADDRARPRPRVLRPRQLVRAPLAPPRLRAHPGRYGSDDGRAPILNDFLTMLFFGLLRRLIARYGIDRTAVGIHNDLLRGIGGVPSVEPARRIAGLARSIRDDATLRELFATNDDAALADRAR